MHSVIKLSSAPTGFHLSLQSGGKPSVGGLLEQHFNVCNTPPVNNRLALPVWWCSSRTAGAAPGNWTLWSTLINDGRAPQTPCRRLMVATVKVKNSIASGEGTQNKNCSYATKSVCTGNRAGGSREGKHTCCLQGSRYNTTNPEVFKGSYTACALFKRWTHKVQSGTRSPVLYSVSWLATFNTRGGSNTRNFSVFIRVNQVGITEKTHEGHFWCSRYEFH